MKVVITIEAEAAYPGNVEDVVDVLETMLPYMFDNVFVRSSVPLLPKHPFLMQ